MFASSATLHLHAAEAEPAPSTQPDPPKPFPLKFGLASYSTRKFDLQTTITMAQRAGLKHLCLKSFHLPLENTAEQTAAAADKVRQAGLDLYGGGVITMNDEAQARQAFAYAKAAGLRIIIGMPAPKILPAVDRLTQEHNIQVAIHNHGPGDQLYPTPASVYEKVRTLSPRIGLCIDVGHTLRVGADPVQAVITCADRLLDLHIKDVSAPQPDGKEIEVGRGVIDIPGLLRALLQIRYAGVVSFEYEKDPEDPLPGLAESVGFTKGVLAALPR